MPLRARLSVLSLNTSPLGETSKEQRLTTASFKDAEE
jgi:hypothetical protein